MKYISSVDIVYRNGLRKGAKDMEIKRFKINNCNYDFVCETKKTRDGFSHIVTMFEDNQEIGKGKVHYLNRTWESYEYQSAIRKTIDMFKKEIIVDNFDGLLEMVG